MTLTLLILTLAAVGICAATVIGYDRELAKARRREQHLLDELDSAVRLLGEPTNVRVIHLHRGGAA